MTDLFIYIYTLPMRMLFLLIPVCVAVYVVIAYAFRRAQIPGTRIWIALVVFWLAVVLAATLHRQAGVQNSGTFQPLLQSYRAAQSNPEYYRENFLNVVLFFPGGLFLRTLVPGWWRRAFRILIPVLLSVVVSLCVETAQLFLNLGLAEMDDLLHNGIGALLGVCTAAAVSALLERKNTRGI